MYILAGLQNYQDMLLIFYSIEQHCDYHKIPEF